MPAGVREPTRVVSVPTAAIKPTLGFWSGPDHAGDGAGDITYVRTWAGFAYTAFVTHPALWRRIVARRWERNLLDPVGCGSSATATSVRRSRPHGHRPPEAHRHTRRGQHPPTAWRHQRNLGGTGHRPLDRGPRAEPGPIRCATVNAVGRQWSSTV